MKYYIITKIELSAEETCTFTDIGVTEDINIANQINESYDETLGKFIGEFKTKIELGIVKISSFFQTVSSVNEARTIVDNIDNLNIKLITNLNQL
jgi:hypothetical protein|tara:strand:- start:314 stop:598 length:285 start_codon:yes stop_codon:yes gene_type:complete